MDTQPNPAEKPTISKQEGKELLQEAMTRFKAMSEADDENRKQGMRDLKFVNLPGGQWEANMKQERGSRPCYEFNKLRIACKRVINDMRSNRPSAKIRAVENGDPKVADVYEGLVRNIFERSDLESITDNQAEFQVNAGMCAWRVSTRYVADDVFDQDIILEGFRNPFTVYCDPACRDPMKRDARDWIVTEKVPHDVFKKKYPNKPLVEFSSGEIDEFDDRDDWVSEKSVRIAEYWFKKPVKKEIWEVVVAKEDGSARKLVIDSTTDEAEGVEEDQILRRKTVNTHKICWAVLSGDSVLEMGEYAGAMFPFVMVYGEYCYIDGKAYWWGLPRFAKDAQRSYNITRTAAIERIAMAPKEYFWATSRQAEGHTSQWADAHKKNYPYRLYEPDPAAPGPPMMVPGADVPVALLNEAQVASDELKAVTGIFDASMGAQGNETSGRAILARQNEGEIATFNFRDNMSKGVQRTAEILIDLIPHIYDTERELRILGTDSSEDYVTVNEVVEDDAGNIVRLNDLRQGKFDVAITSGPSFSTRRQEASETYSQLLSSFPELMGVAGDLVFKSIDLPYAEDIAERLQFLLPPEIQQTLNQETEIPPEVQQMMTQAEQAMAAVEEQAAALAEAEQEVGKRIRDAEQAEHSLELQGKDLRILQADLKTAKATFEKDVAAGLAKLDGAEPGEVDPAIQTVATAVQSLDKTLAAFMQAASSRMEMIESGGMIPPNPDTVGDGDGLAGGPDV